jgi:hypothetical protein
MPVLASTPKYEAFLVNKKFSLTLVGPWIQALTKLVFCLLIVGDLST